MECEIVLNLKETSCIQQLWQLLFRLIIIIIINIILLDKIQNFIF